MSDPISRDPLLDLLARTAKDMDADDAHRDHERWTEGTLAPEDAAALDEAARQSVTARRLADTYRPLGDDFQDRVVAALRAQPGGGAEATAAEAAPRPRSGWLASAAMVVLAAALTALFLRPGSAPPIPAYQLTLGDGVQSQRTVDGAPAESVRRFVIGSRWQLSLRPASPVDGEVAVAFFLDSGRTLSPWMPPLEQAENGSVRVAGRLGAELQIDPGAWTLWVAIGRPGELPTAAELSTRADRSATDTPDGQLHRVDFVVDAE